MWTSQTAERREVKFGDRCMLEKKRWEYAVHEKNEERVTTEA